MPRIDLTEAAAMLEVDESLEIEIGDQSIALCRTEAGLFAIDGICSHAYAKLTEGYVMDGFIECPLHQAQFDLASGALVTGPECPALKTWPIVVEDGTVYLDY
ncbi:MAG: non-heme iron oxygenase ferredoxin subunit [Burkholderiaceae bacterium]|nr:non-heme iron oxygenase ferredoxin subunit [Burkholderiaceae bacterium]